MKKKQNNTQVNKNSIYNYENQNKNTDFQSLKSLEASWIQKQKIKRKSKKKKRLSRSWYGDLILSLFLGFFALFSAYPLVFTICNSLKPLNEILSGERATNIYNGFSRRIAVESLCQKCGYATRFKK